MINRMNVNFLRRRLPWLWLALIPPDSPSQDCLFGSPVLRAETQPPERIASHDSHLPFGVSDRSVVSAALCADFLNRFVQHFIGSLWWL